MLELVGAHMGENYNFISLKQSNYRNGVHTICRLVGNIIFLNLKARLYLKKFFCSLE